MFSCVSMLKIFHVQSSLAVATICFLMWRAIPPMPLVWASILTFWTNLEFKGSYSRDRKGFGLASSGKGVSFWLPLPSWETPKASIPLAEYLGLSFWRFCVVASCL
jgi:hypothetical protein